MIKFYKMLKTEFWDWQRFCVNIFFIMIICFYHSYLLDCFFFPFFFFSFATTVSAFSAVSLFGAPFFSLSDSYLSFLILSPFFIISISFSLKGHLFVYPFNYPLCFFFLLRFLLPASHRLYSRGASVNRLVFLDAPYFWLYVQTKLCLVNPNDLLFRLFLRKMFLNFFRKTNC